MIIRPNQITKITKKIGEVVQSETKVITNAIKTVDVKTNGIDALGMQNTPLVHKNVRETLSPTKLKKNKTRISFLG